MSGFDGALPPLPDTARPEDMATHEIKINVGERMGCSIVYSLYRRMNWSKLCMKILHLEAETEGYFALTEE